MDKYLRISTSELFDGTIDLDKGIVEYSDKMRNLTYDQEDSFRSKVILQINEAVNGRWHIHFNRFPNGKYDADVYVESDIDFQIIGDILVSELKDYLVKPLWKKQFRLDLFGLT
jgi:hypothetical protein